MNIHKVIIPAAGWGTRFLPQTKAMPKEMLPIVDKPVIQYVVEEAVSSGIKDVILITGWHKRAIEDHFDRSLELEKYLCEKGKNKEENEIKKIAELANFIYIRQKGPAYGNAVPVLAAEPAIGNEPFAVLWGDEFIWSDPPRLAQMLAVYKKYKGAVISAVKIESKDNLSRYGIADLDKVSGNVSRIKRIVEKPLPGKAPSDLATHGAYILPPEIFGIIRKLKPGRGGEIWLVDAINLLIKKKFPVYACEVKNSVYYDTGNKLEYLKTVVETTKDILKEVYKSRPAESVKYDFGLLVVIGGSDFYSGSPALSAMAAFRSGADMTRIIAPKRAADIIASFSPALAAYPLEGKRLERIHLAAIIGQVESAKEVSRGKTALVIGGGLGRSEETQETVLELLKQVSVPAVIDADAIHALAKNPEIVSGKNFLITPHTYEFFVLTKKEVYSLSQEEKIRIVREEALRLQATILLKGKTDIISDGKEVALNKTGSPYMTKGGTGDTLAGICGALLARKINPFVAAQAAAYINGRAGEIAAQRAKEGFVVTDDPGSFIMTLDGRNTARGFVNNI
jgi:UTP--glucose-1-phosphate uridylyltransferase